MYFITDFFLGLVLTQFSLSSPDVVENILEVFCLHILLLPPPPPPPNSAGQGVWAGAPTQHYRLDCFITFKWLCLNRLFKKYSGSIFSLEHKTCDLAENELFEKAFKYSTRILIVQSLIDVYILLVRGKIVSKNMVNFIDHINIT